jgi:hypothetical protein
MAMSEQIPLKFDHERWLDEYELRKREIEIKERDQSRSTNQLHSLQIKRKGGAICNQVTVLPETLSPISST